MSRFLVSSLVCLFFAANGVQAQMFVTLGMGTKR
jgi:hypothetical protein